MAQDAALSAVFEPVAPLTTFEETVDRLGTAIRLGILPPGTRLPSERELADQLDISRSTLRQAITTLVQSGHLHSVRGRGGGTFVALEPPLARAGERLRPDWREVLDLRLALETGAATLAASRADPATLEQMRECVALMASQPEFDDYRRADIRFHIGVAEASYSPRLVTAMTEVQGQMSDLIARIAHPDEVLRSSNEQHRRLVALLRRRDVGNAVRLMREHMDGTEHILAGLLPERPG